jgi:hypothetical protein
VKYQVLDKLKAKTPQGYVELSPGQLISLEPEKAIKLVETGKIKPLTAKKPSLKSDETLVIPFDSDPKYHWWAGGQSIADTLAELEVSLEVWRQYTSEPYLN